MSSTKKLSAKRLIATFGVVGLLGGGLAACSSDDSSDASGGNESGPVELTVWASQEDLTAQSGQDTSWVEAAQKAFEEAHPDYDISWRNDVVSAADAATTVAQDSSAAADVYVFANDQLGSLLDAGAIGQLSADGEEQLAEQASDIMAASVADQDGNEYGLPIEPNVWFMYYNTAALSEEDVKSFDTMLEKARVSFPMSNSWYFPAFYAAAGATFFGEDGLDADAGVDLGDRAGEVSEYLASVVANPNFVNDTDGAGLGGLANGTVDVMFSGAWDAQNVKEVLGDDFGVAALPTFNLNGDELQLKAFSGSKAVAYNPNTDSPRIAAEFAAFLADTESQLRHYEFNGVIPSDQTLADDPAIKDDEVALALIDTVENASILQPTFTEMTLFWEPTENFGTALVNGDITAANAEEKTDALQSAL